MNFSKSIIVISFLFLVSVVVVPSPLTLFASEAEKEVEHETGFYYIIQKGDTLWDLSEHFSNSPWLWPELWNENDHIPNPHWIYPGERIRLYRQTDVDKYGKKKKVKVAEPAPEPVPTPAPAPIVATRNDLEPEEQPFYIYSAINKVGFIRKGTEIVPSGVVIKVKDNKEIISIGDLIYIKPNNPETSSPLPGAKYTIYRTLAPTKAKNARNSYL